MCSTVSTMTKSAVTTSFNSIAGSIAAASLGASGWVDAANSPQATGKRQEEKPGALGLMLNVIAS